MRDPLLLELIERDHEALRRFMAGDPGPKKALYSRRDDVTLANPLGPPAVGWAAVEARLEQAASSLRGAGDLTFDRVAFVESSELAYTVEFEHYSDQFIVGSDEAHLIDLRVTTVFRREDGAWRIVHRHADPIVTARGIETALRGGSANN